MKFEIFNSGDFIRIEEIKTSFHDAEMDWDKNWLLAKIAIKAGSFSGQFNANFMTTDFEMLKRDLKNLNINFSGTAHFEPLENQVSLKISGDGLGHFDVNCTAIDESGCGVKLIFTLNFDQTELSRLINELEIITKSFPIKGDLRITNE